MYLSIKIYSSIHLVIFAAQPAPIFKALKNYFLWFFMITLQLTGPNNGNRTLAPNTSKIVNKNTILDFYTFLSNLKVLKCNMHFNLKQIVEKYTCLLSREIGFLARQIGRGRRGAFILDLCAQLICAFVFESAKSRVSHDTAHTKSGVVDLSALWPTRPQD